MTSFTVTPRPRDARIPAMADSDAVDRQQLVKDFCATAATTDEVAVQYLGAHNWDLAAAITSYYADGDDDKDDIAEPASEEPYTGPRTLDGRPAPQAYAQPSRSRASQPKRKGVATLGSLGGAAHQHDDDDDEDDDYSSDADDDGRGNLFAGGEKSGLAVQDPRQEGSGPRSIINDILAKARANSSRPENADPEAGPSRPSHFRGTGMTLGGEGVESRSIPNPLGPARSTNAEPQERVLHIWRDGFSIDDGELRRFDDPANQADLAMIRSGRAPLHLMNVQHDQPVDVKLHQHPTPYVPQPKQYKPFAGSGQRLGSPVPGGSSGTATPPTSGAAPAAAATSDAAPAVDSSQPTIMIRIQMPDGTRLPARFNTTHTIGDVYGFVQGASPETRSRPWVLATTFPNKDHTDKDLVLGEVPEFKKGGTAVVKWA
ncbi:SEP domain-containingprotein [Purpureocillium lavendulum]|uniref:SEP domain-containingprotein n=1 Tax=Purpureocillium lavendulum TaxID=1247861 RepID=A0AB34FHB5_9HYPO|nr:SEP domain-containingprotein [Purpureocillium lavendulum]